MALNSAANVLGFIIGPAFAYAFTFFSFHLNEIKIDSYTLPGYFSALMSLAGTRDISFTLFTMSLGLISLVFLKEISVTHKRNKKTTSTPGKTQIPLTITTVT